MSWSVNLIGQPQNIIAALKEIGEKMTDANSKQEFEAALPHMEGILEQNFNTNYPVAIQFVAHGHGTKDSEGKFISRALSVKTENLPGTLV